MRKYISLIEMNEQTGKVSYRVVSLHKKGIAPPSHLGQKNISFGFNSFDIFFDREI